MFQKRGRHAEERAPIGPKVRRIAVYAVVSLVIVALVVPLFWQPGSTIELADDTTPVAASDEADRLERHKGYSPATEHPQKQTMPISRSKMEDILAADDVAEVVTETGPAFDAEEDVVQLNRFGGVVVEDAPQKEQSEIIAENAFDPAAERELWKPRPAPQADGGRMLSAEAEALVAASSLRERMQNLNLPINPTAEEVQRELVRLGRVVVLTEQLDSATAIKVGVHFGNTSSLHHAETAYHADAGGPVEREVFSLLISHPQRMGEEALDNVSEAALDRLACQENPQMYYRAMLLVDYVIWEQTGHHIKIASLHDPTKFSDPGYLPEEIAKNACFGQE